MTVHWSGSHKSPEDWYSFFYLSIMSRDKAEREVLWSAWLWGTFIFLGSLPTGREVHITACQYPCDKHLAAKSATLLLLIVRILTQTFQKVGNHRQFEKRLLCWFIAALRGFPTSPKCRFLWQFVYMYTRTEYLGKFQLFFQKKIFSESSRLNRAKSKNLQPTLIHSFLHWAVSILVSLFLFVCFYCCCCCFPEALVELFSVILSLHFYFFPLSFFFFLICWRYSFSHSDHYRIFSLFSICLTAYLQMTTRWQDFFTFLWQETCLRKRKREGMQQNGNRIKEGNTNNDYNSSWYI